MRPKVEKISVQFIQKNAPYNVGEIAGFPIAVAKKLVQGKKAIFVGDEHGGEPVEAFEAVHVGGGYYEVGGHRVKGKKEAQKYAEELNSGSREAAPADEE